MDDLESLRAHFDAFAKRFEKRYIKLTSFINRIDNVSLNMSAETVNLLYSNSTCILKVYRRA